MAWDNKIDNLYKSQNTGKSINNNNNNNKENWIAWLEHQEKVQLQFFFKVNIYLAQKLR